MEDNVVISKILGVVLISGALAFGYIMDDIADKNSDHSYVVQFQRGTTPGLDYSATAFEAIEQLNSNPAYHVFIIGHTGTRGPESANQELGLKRANRVRKDFRFQGIAADRIHVLSRGEMAPLVQGKHETDSLWQKRLARVGIFVTVDQEAFSDE